MAESAENSIRNIKGELREATQQAVALNVQLAELQKPGSNATEEQIAAVNAQLSATIEKTAELKDTINDTNERIGVLAAGSPFEKLSNNLGDVGSKIASLDFDGAAESAQNLASIGKSISFKDAIGSVKSLGSTFLQLGKALLTNPLFLLAAVIIALVVAIAKVLDKLGILKKITEAVGAVFDWLFGLIESVVTAITDFFGLTSEAEREATAALQRNAEQAEKTAKSQEQKSESVVQGIDNEIRLATLAGKNTEQLERKKVQEIRKTAKARYEADAAAYKAALAQGELTKEEIADLKEKARVSRLASQQAGADVVFFEEKTKKAKSDALKKTQEEQDKADKESADKRKANFEKAKAQREAYDRDRLQAIRAIKDLELAALQDGVEKELAISAEKYKRLIEDNAKNDKLTADEKLKLNKLLTEAGAADEKKIQDAANKKKEDDKKASDEALLKLQEDFYNKFGLLGLTETEKLKRQREDQFSEDKKALDKALADKLLSQEEYLIKLGLLTDAKNKDIAKIQADADKAALDEQKRVQAEKVKVITDGIKGIADAFTNLGKTLGSELATGIGTAFTGINSLIAISQTEFEDSAKGRAEQVSAYTQAIGSIISSFLSLAVEANKEKLAEETAAIDEKLATDNALLKQQLDNRLITQEQFDKGSSDLQKKANAEKDKAGKKAFEDNKKLQIAQATIAGLTGAVSAFTGAMSLGPIAGPIVGGILAAAVVAMTAVNVSKIKSTQYASSSTGGGGGGASMGSSSTSSSAPAQPQFNLFGGGNNANTVGPGAQANNNMTVQVNSQVSVTEINDVQNKVAVQEDRATL
jgi:hypothetical protein